MRRAWAHEATTVLLAAGLACTGTPEDPIEALQYELESAAEDRDAERFGARLSEELQGPRGLTRSDGLDTLRRYFAAYESVDLEVYGVEVERDGDTAEVRCVVEFAGRARQIGGLKGLLPPAAVYRFALGVADEGGVWRVRRASWERVSPHDVGGD